MVKGIVKMEDGKPDKNSKVKIYMGEGKEIKEYDCETNAKGKYEKVISLIYIYIYIFNSLFF